MSSSRVRSMRMLRVGAMPATVMPRPRRNSSRPSSRKVRSARSTVLWLTPRTAARSRAGGSRSPARASPSAMARRTWAATCSCSGVASDGSSCSDNMMPLMLAPSDMKGWLVDAAKVQDAAAGLRGDVLIEEARRRQRRRRKLLTLLMLIVLVVAGVSAAIVVRHGASRGAAAGARQPSNGAGQPVGQVSMRQPEALATLPDGSVLIADQGRDQVLRRAPTGQLTVFAGDGRPGYGGDGGPATSAQINNPGGLAVAGDGTV